MSRIIPFATSNATADFSARAVYTDANNYLVDDISVKTAMIQELINELIYMNIGGLTPLIYLAESKTIDELECFLDCPEAVFYIIAGFAKRGDKKIQLPFDTQRALEARLIGYIVGDHLKEAGTLIKGNRSLILASIRAQAFLGKTTQVNLAIKTPNNNAHYNKYLSSAIEAYALSNRQEPLLELLKGSNKIELATLHAARGGNTDLVDMLLQKQQREIGRELLSASALKGYAIGHHVEQAAQLITAGAPLSIWAQTIQELSHCNEKMNLMLLLACFDDKERQSHYLRAKPILQVELSEDELELVGQIQTARQSADNLFQACYQVISGDNSNNLAELATDKIANFVDEHMIELRPGPNP